jgi:hypothetical protein
MRRNSNMKKIKRAFDRETLALVCELPELEFGNVWDLDKFSDLSEDPEDFYYFRDNGSSILAVAHLDTVAPGYSRGCHFLSTEAGEVVYSRALDDRLGAYIILELLPALGINHDILLTVGEESGQSTAMFFDPPKDYDWIIEFDRGGTDVVMYSYETPEIADLVRDAGAVVGEGIFTDICYLEHLGCKGFNWGVGYRDYHGPRSHAYLEDTFSMLSKYLKFHRVNAGVAMPHVEDHGWWRGWRRGGSSYPSDAWLSDSRWDDIDAEIVDAEVVEQQEDIADLVAEYPSLAQLSQALDGDFSD